jgi:hypothetical protein
VAPPQAARSGLEGRLQDIRAAAALADERQLLALLLPAVEVCAGAVDGNAELLLCLKQLRQLADGAAGGGAGSGAGARLEASPVSVAGSVVAETAGFQEAGPGEAALQLQAVCDRVGLAALAGLARTQPRR